MEGGAAALRKNPGNNREKILKPAEKLSGVFSVCVYGLPGANEFVLILGMKML